MFRKGATSLFDPRIGATSLVSVPPRLASLTMLIGEQREMGIGYPACKLSFCAYLTPLKDANSLGLVGTEGS
jgi:hypothetical protein